MSDMTLARLNVLLGAETSDLDRALKDIEAKVEKTGKKLSSVGRGLTKNVTAPLLAIGAAGFKVAGDFEASLAKMEGLVGIQRDQIDAWRGDIRDLAVDYGASATEAADALFFITSAGLRGSDAMDVLEASLKGAAAGLGDVATIADLSTSAMNAYGPEVLGAAQATDVLTAAVREGKLEPAQLAGAMGQVLPVASNMGIRFDEVGAAMAAMSRTGTNAQTAAVQLRQIMVSLLKPTAEADTALKEMGLSAEGLRSQIRDQGLLATLQTLSAEFEGNADAQAKVFGNVRALAGVMDLMGASADTTAGIFAELENTAGTLDDAFDKQSTSMFKLSQMWAALKDLALEIGNAISGPTTAAIERMTGVLKGLTAGIGGLPGPVLAAGVAFAALAAATGPALLVLGKIMTMAPLVAKGYAGLLTVTTALKAPLLALAAAKTLAASAAGLLWAALAPILPIVAAVGAAVAASVFVWRKWGDDITLAVKAVASVIKDRLEPLADIVRGVARGFVKVVKWWWDNVTMRVVRGVRDVAVWLIDKLGPILKKSAQGWAKLLRVVSPTLASALDAVVDFVDDTRKEMVRLRAGVEEETTGAAAALDDFRASLAEFSQAELELTATGLGRNLIEAEKKLDRLKKAQEAAASGSVAGFERATAAVAEQEANVRQLRASYEAAAKAALGAGEAAATTSPGGGGGDGGAGEQAKAIAEVREELEAALAEADAMGALLGKEFDVAAAKTNAYETAVRDLVAAEVELGAVVGPQGETLRQLADTYLDLRGGVEGAIQAEREKQRLMSEGEAITNRLMTAEEQREAQLERLDDLLTAGAISEEFHARAVKAAEDAYHATTPAGERYLELLRAQDQVLREVQTPLERYEERLALLDEMLTTVDETTGEALLTQEEYNRAVALAGEELDRAMEAASGAVEPMDELGRTIEGSMDRGLSSAIRFTTSSESRFKQWGVAVANEITKVMAKLAALHALSAIVPGGSFLASALSLPARASGGPVRGREPVLVGERGPEVFVPTGAGQIVANQHLGGGTLRLDTTSLPPRPAALTPEALATDDWWRRAFGHLKLDYDDRGGL